MTDEEIEAYRKRLNELTIQCSKGESEQKLQPKLAQLAREVGASTCVFYVRGAHGKGTTGPADTSELIRNIHQALQTASMVNMCRRASEGYRLAIDASTDASKNFRITAVVAIASAVVAFLSAAAAWAAVLCNR